MFVFYAGGLYLVLRWLSLEGSAAMVSATIIFFPTLLLTIYASDPVNEFVQQIVYGNGRVGDDTLTNITLSLSARPELAALEQIVELLADSLGVSKAMLLVKNEKGTPFLAAAVGVESIVPVITESVSQAVHPVLRSAAHSLKEAGQIFRGFDWAELLVPIIARNKQVGLLAFSRPGEDGYFNAHQVTFLTQAAGVLAVGSDNITLFETARALSRQALFVREQERKQLAARIHDDPLQQITYATHALEQVVVAPFEKRLEDRIEWLTPIVGQLRSAATTLRHICLGLYPPFWDQGVELAVRDVVNQFQRQNNLNVDLVVTGMCDDLPAEAVTASTCHILTECLNNVIKHGDGTEVRVLLLWTPLQMTLRVEDKGPGSDEVIAPYSDLLRRQHLGIVGMYEWAELVDGILHIDRNEPTGVKVEFVCPVSKNRV